MKDRLITASISVLLASAALALPTPRTVRTNLISSAFAPHDVFTAGLNPFSVAMGDLNGDGKRDLVIANSGASPVSTVSVLFNITAPGANDPDFASKVDFATGTAPSITTFGVTIADLNADGKPDIAVANSDGISVLRNFTPLGGTTPFFATKQDFTTELSSRAWSVTVSDVNGDGLPDLTATCQSAGRISVLLNTTPPGSLTFSFAAHQDIATPFAQSVAVADLNGDGIADMASVGQSSPDNVSVYRNTTVRGSSTVTYAARQEFATGPAVDGSPLPWTVAIGDFNLDGKPDLAMACILTDRLSVLLNTTPTGATTFSFSTYAVFAGLDHPMAVAVADINGDLKPDVVMTYQNPSNLSVFLNITSPGATTPAFAAKQDFATGASPRSVAVGDLNGDGKLDLVTGNYNASNVSVLLNTTVAGMIPAYSTRPDFTTASFAEGVVAADFNGDGKPDFAVAAFFADLVSVFLNTTLTGDGSPTFATRQDFSTGDAPARIRTGDFNNDGKPDLLTLNAVSGNLSLLRNTTPPGASLPAFARQDVSLGALQNIDAAVMDVNADGRADIVVVDSNTAEVSILANQTTAGASSFTFAANVVFTTFPEPRALAIGDVNGDGKPDVAVVSHTRDSVSVLVNATSPGGAPFFGAATEFASAGGPNAVKIRDLNGDGRPDLVVVGDTAGFLSVLLNTTVAAATPSFTTHQDFSTGTGPVDLDVGDLNGDGMPDVVTTNNAASTMSVLLNTTAPGATTQTFAPKLELLTGNHHTGAVITDLNGDSLLDFAQASQEANGLSLVMGVIPTYIEMSAGHNQSTETNTAYPTQLKAWVADSYGYPVQHATVVYAVVPDAELSGGTFASSPTVFTDSGGFATAPVITANSVPGGFSVTATVAGVLPANFTLFILFGPPPNFVATATSTSSVSVSWSARPGATEYTLQRQSSVPGSTTTLLSHTTSLGFTDNTVGPNTAYLYKVFVVEPESGVPARDIATTVVFADPTLTSGMPVKAAHFNELRNAVNLIRVLLNQGAFSFTDALVAQTTTIMALHLSQIRQELDSARSQLLVPAINYTHGAPVNGTPITAADLIDLRNGVK